MTSKPRGECRELIKKLSILFLLVLLAVGLALCVEGKQFKGKKRVADYNVSGDIDSNATGNYFEAGTYAGKSYYRKTDGAWFIWWDTVDEEWNISSTLGVYTNPGWYREESGVIGTYSRTPLAVGLATVSAGPQ